MPGMRTAAAVAAALAAGAAHAAGAPEPLAGFENRGPDLPPAGRSLFDHAMAVRGGDGAWTIDVPWPYEALVARIESHLGPAHRAKVKQVLHPIGRSLHRNAAAPHYFRYPRAVGAVDAEAAAAPGESGLMLRDRLYLGYQPLSESVEVVSYNEAAGRFEYQIVEDYRADGARRTAYADRALCLACHHNRAAIYAEQPWAETNNSNLIAALLAREADAFYGVPARVPFDAPELFDDSTDRATYFAAYQRVWRGACAAAGDRAAAVACRRDGLVSALRYRLTARYQLDEAGDGARERFGRAVARGWRARWPDGVAVPDSDIADFDPLAGAGYGAGRSALEAGRVERIAWTPPPALHFDGAFEPLHERPPREVWRVPPPFAGRTVEPAWVDKAVAGLGEFFAAVDISRLDSHLAAGARTARRLRAPCEVAETPGAVDFRCAAVPGGPRLSGRARISAGGAAAGVIGRVRARSAAPGGLELIDGRLEDRGGERRLRFGLADAVAGLTARLADGSAVLEVEIAWPADGGGGAEAVLSVADDFAALAAAADRLAGATLAGASDALGEAPFRRVALLRPLFADLGMAPVAWCCLEADGLPPPRRAGEP